MTGFGFGAPAQTIGYGNTILVADGLVVAGVLTAIQRYATVKRSRVIEKAA